MVYALIESMLGKGCEFPSVLRARVAATGYEEATTYIKLHVGLEQVLLASSAEMDYDIVAFMLVKS